MQLLFWPFMILSVVLAILSLNLRKPLFLVIASVLILPISLYLAATPRFEIWGLIFPLFYAGAAWYLKQRKIWLSVVLVIPNFLLIGWLGFAVLTQ